MENRKTLEIELELAKRWRDQAFEDYFNANQKVNYVRMQLAKGNGGAGSGRAARGGLEARSLIEKIQPLERKPVPKTKTAFIAPDGCLI